jgi:hypothetical protein
MISPANAAVGQTLQAILTKWFNDYFITYQQPQLSLVLCLPQVENLKHCTRFPIPARLIVQNVYI